MAFDADGVTAKRFDELTLTDHHRVNGLTAPLVRHHWPLVAYAVATAEDPSGRAAWEYARLRNGLYPGSYTPERMSEIVKAWLDQQIKATPKDARLQRARREMDLPEFLSYCSWKLRQD